MGHNANIAEKFILKSTDFKLPACFVTPTYHVPKFPCNEHTGGDTNRQCADYMPRGTVWKELEIQRFNSATMWLGVPCLFQAIDFHLTSTFD